MTTGTYFLQSSHAVTVSAEPGILFNTFTEVWQMAGDNRTTFSPKLINYSDQQYPVLPELNLYVEHS